MREHYMKRKEVYRVLSIIISFIMLFSVINLPTIKAKADSGSGVEGFVERCYTVILGRPSEPDGLKYWTEALKNGERVGTNVAYGFVFSNEYADRNRSNEEFVNDMYSLVLDREADEGGYEYWCSKLENGETRQQVYGGFVNSPEFYGICQQYGITAGYFLAEYDYMQVNNVNLFVDRLYRTCLGRPGDQGGQEYWVRALINKEITGIECAAGFVNSIEYRNNGLSNEDYVENMYSACLGRQSEPNGKAYWVNALVNGMTRDELFAGFANSEELNNICAEYGIIRGDYTPTEIGTFDPNNPNNIPIPDHTHDYSKKNTDSKYLKSEATCTEAAVYYYSCECGEKGTDTFTSGKPLGHNWNEGEVTKEPTEKEEGIKQYKCTRCGETKTESIAKLNHTHVFDKKVVAPNYIKSKATCTEPAEYYLSCECGEAGTETFISGTALGHDWDDGEIKKEATIWEEGIKTYRCKRTGCNETKTEVIPCIDPNFKVGDTVVFGKYEQDGDTSNGKEDIEWQVLKIESNRILVISKYALDLHRYNKNYSPVTWEESELRKWLNGDFLNDSFSSDERKQIPTVSIENKGNAFYGIPDENNTEDKVFCLSLEEAETLFGDYNRYDEEKAYGFNQKLICSPVEKIADQPGFITFTITEDHYNNILKDMGYTPDVIGVTGIHWYLRTSNITGVTGLDVAQNGCTGAGYTNDLADGEIAVRPAMYIEY